jgi:hypothetical protein
MAFASFVILWGVYTFMKDDRSEIANNQTEQMIKRSSTASPDEEETLLTQRKRRELDKIGTVINEDNADIDHETKNEIKIAKKDFDAKRDLKEKQVLLEQSYMDRNSSVKDIKKLQSDIVEAKNKMKVELANTEKWDPKFVYYLMLQENYTYAEINMIKSLSENGLNPDEISYITELIKEDSFKERIQAFKANGETGRSVASAKKKPKEKDDFIEDPLADAGSVESKLIEMNYNQDEREEMVYGSAQQQQN